MSDNNTDGKSGSYIPLRNLETYKLARELSRLAWKTYERLSWQDKKAMGDQFISATDSVGANITEGYGRFHFLDRIKFFYNARGSLFETNDYWIELLFERQKLTESEYHTLKQLADKLLVKLNNFITATYRSKSNHGKK